MNVTFRLGMSQAMKEARQTRKKPLPTLPKSVTPMNFVSSIMC